jgi:perosamine synthetase
MHKQPIYNKMGYFKNDFHPNAERLAERGFYVPGGLALSEEEITTVSEKLIEIVSE